MVVSPLNTTEKRDSDERRVIMDLSFPPGGSVNDRIPKDSYLGEATGLRYPSVDASTQLVRVKGAGCALMKCDLKRAYKQIQVDPRDWNFLGMKWQGKLYFDMTMPMGLRSAAMCCQRLTNAIAYIMRSHGFDLVAYLDDMVTAECWEQAGACFSTQKEVIATMGAVEAESKAVSPCMRMNFLGICFDTELLTMEVPQERISECMSLLVNGSKKRRWRGRKWRVWLASSVSLPHVSGQGGFSYHAYWNTWGGFPGWGRWRCRCQWGRIWCGGKLSYHTITECPWCLWRGGPFLMKWWQRMHAWVVVVHGLRLRESTFMQSFQKGLRDRSSVSMLWSY